MRQKPYQIAAPLASRQRCDAVEFGQAMKNPAGVGDAFGGASGEICAATRIKLSERYRPKPLPYLKMKILCPRKSIATA